MELAEKECSQKTARSRDPKAQAIIDRLKKLKRAERQALRSLISLGGARLLFIKNGKQIDITRHVVRKLNKFL